jgi:trans-2,3-dihydro-3-hydroxyanthranilate isomerase
MIRMPADGTLERGSARAEELRPFAQPPSRLVSFELVDVFTTTRFGGNQLAVFQDATGIPERLLQPIARELNLSETAFAYPRSRNEWGLRIFTPTMEHPFAGHPTIGASLILSRAEQLTRLVLHEQVGPVPVTVERTNGQPLARLEVPVTPEERDVGLALGDLAAMISLAPEEIRTDRPSVNAMSCGVPFLFVELSSREALKRARLRVDDWKRLLAPSWSPHVYLFTIAPDDAGTLVVHSRMFAPAMGIAEDPATGGAAAALAGVLAKREPSRRSRLEWTIFQGADMGRPSTLHLSATVDSGRARRIRVGGSAVKIGSGSLDLSVLERAG